MREIHFSRFTLTFTYCTDTLYLLLIEYIYYINNLCQPDIKNITGNLYKLYIAPMCEICLGRLAVTFIYCNDTF